jgi:hypothetical protein
MTATTLLIQHNFIRSMLVNSGQLRRAFKAAPRRKKRKRKIGQEGRQGKTMVRKPTGQCVCALHGSVFCMAVR